ncbi:hypothetical protein QYM36_011028 [Artemia franciscana]|uniref:FAST kinase leucine-rich domain-containing protein n=1 Tax=Artemia franciscana TaxID=6661 RepID=A0AA88KYE9_ARTSF|nr:hypothetical protein QYM36_011028 [Artemia franciscana]
MVFVFHHKMVQKMKLLIYLPNCKFWSNLNLRRSRKIHVSGLSRVFDQVYWEKRSIGLPKQNLGDDSFFKRKHKSENLFNLSVSLPLYEMQDELLKNILNTTEIDELILLLAKNENKLNYKHISQVIWSIYIIAKGYIMEENQGMVDEKEYSDLRNDIGSKIMNKMDHMYLLDLIEGVLEKMDLDSVVRVLLALSWLASPLTETLNSKFVSLLIKDLDHLNSEGLAVLSTAIRYNKETIGEDKNYFLGHVLNSATKKLDCCENVECLQNLAIVFYRTSHLLQEDVIENFKDRLQLFLDSNQVTKKQPKYLLRFLQCLAVQKDRNLHEMGVVILKLLEPVIDELHPYELLWLNTVLARTLEPTSLIQKVAERSSRLLEMSKSLTPMSRLNLLSCVRYVPAPSRRKIEDLLIIALEDTKFKFRFRDILQTIKLSRTRKPAILDSFWVRIIEACDNHTSEYYKYVLLSHACTWYLDHVYLKHRSNRCREFESYARTQFLKNSVYSRAYLKGALPFIIATSDYEIPDSIVQAFQNMLLNDTFVINLMKGIDSSIFWHSTKVPRILAEQFSDIKKRLESYTMTRCDEIKSIYDCSRAVASVSRKSEPNRVFMEICQRKLDDSNEPLNSAVICDILDSFLHRNWALNKAFNAFVNYVIEQKENIAITTIGKILRYLYHFGFVPEKSKEFAELAADKLIRGTGEVQGLTILQGALALNFLQYLPLELVKKIFSASFLDYLDAEIDSESLSYPANVRRSLMLLNRAVCLGSPEAKVPWFHEQYCQSILHTKQGKFFYCFEKPN